MTFLSPTPPTADQHPRCPPGPAPATAANCDTDKDRQQAAHRGGGGSTAPSAGLPVGRSTSAAGTAGGAAAGDNGGVDSVPRRGVGPRGAPAVRPRY